MPYRVDLADYNKDQVKVFAGRAYGEAVRRKVGLPRLESDGQTIEVLIPDDVFSVNSSFFLGMFGDSVRQLGESEFRRRYKFVGANVGLVIEDAIREAVATESPLAGAVEEMRRRRR